MPPLESRPLFPQRNAVIHVLEQTPVQKPDLVEIVRRFFSPEGPLAKAANFEYRPQQQEMAAAVAEALVRGEHLLVEAGTGVGKSLAYLVPAILYAVAEGRKAIVSTHTINLQEQLTGKDLPLLQKVLQVPFSYTMLKGRQNYLCTRRLHKAMQQADGLFTTPEQAELRRIYEWSQRTEDGSLSDFEIEPDPKVWAQVCSERGLCSPKLCGPQSDFVKGGRPPCFFQRVRHRILSADLLVLNHTLFFMHLGGLEEEPPEGGILFRNDFVIFDEAHTVERVASKHIGAGVSQAQLRWTLQRLWNPRTEKGLLSLLRKGRLVEQTAELYKAADAFFARIEEACERLRAEGGSRFGRRGESKPRRWTELRVRRPDLIEDTLSLPIQRLRESLKELIDQAEDKDIGTELLECSRRLGELREAAAVFLSQSAPDHVYWVERSGKGGQNLALHAAPVDVADFLRQRLFGADTSVIMTSATLATKALAGSAASAQERPLEYFARRVGGESARQLQLGSPFDFARQVKLYVASKMPDPRHPDYRKALIRWIAHFVRMTRGKAFVLFTNARLMRDTADAMAPFFDERGVAGSLQGVSLPRLMKSTPT
ncbi:MAG: DEAD/DEAH box helicase, partial [Verrucomicrobia bacterium]|nr:DEAD/DEAH box helicase [Verrucomicrobiota bacterium]